MRFCLSFLFGCLACVVVTSVVKADGRVFVLNLRNSSGLQGFRDAERACASQHARLASAQELRHAVVECYFSPCTRGWLFGGAVGTTVCNVVGSALKAVDVRTENATDGASNLNAFCIKDRGVPCGDPPSFPNARLQGHSGYEMGDELLYTCVPGYLMPNGHRAFSLLCDSCGEWYGLVEICVKDETESHIDYEDKFPDSYGDAEHHTEGPAEAYGRVHEEVHGGAFPSQEQQETSFNVEEEEEHQDEQEVPDVEGQVIGGKFGGLEKDDELDDFVGHPTWEQERSEAVTTDAAAATQAPVSLLSQKHLFWFPSEAFQEEGRPAPSNPVTQTTLRASGAQSEESKEQESQETHHHQQHPVDVGEKETDSIEDQEPVDHDDDNNSRTVDKDDQDSQQEEDDHEDRVTHHIPAQHEELDHHKTHDDHDDHYDMGEHEEERKHVRFGNQDYDDRDDTYDGRESHEDRGDLTDDRVEDDHERPHSSEEHPDQDDHEEDQHEVHYDPEEEENDHYSDHDDHNNHDDHDDNEDHYDHDTFDDHDSHEDDGHQHVIISIPQNEGQNDTQKASGGKATTDDTWLDGYPVVQVETENGDSTTNKDEERVASRATDRPNEVEIRRPVSSTISQDDPEFPTVGTSLEQGRVEEKFPGSISTTAPLQPSDIPSNSDTQDYDTQQSAPTRSWLGGPTEHPFLDQDAAPPMSDSDILSGIVEEHTVNLLPGETGERGEMEGEMGGAMCTDEDCPPHPPGSSTRAPTVAAIIAVVCMVAVAVIVGVWCYRRQQQKSSMYEMNGKGQNQSRQGQQIEMQQKV